MQRFLQLAGRTALLLSLGHATLSLAATGAQTAAALQHNYDNTRTACDDETIPAHACSGVLLRSTRASPAYHTWNNSPNSLAKGGVAQWFVQHLGLEPVLQFILGIPGVGGSTLSTSHLGRFMVFVYIWLPFMILPIQASLERLPPSLLQASADLGARPGQTFVQVILPLSIPGIAAGSIFTFSLTLGDFIVPQLVGPPGYFIGSMVYAQQGAIGNMPMAAAFTLVPIVLIAIYLSIVKRLGAFDAL